MAGWSPLGGTEWLRNPDWVLGEERPERPVSVPRGRNGLPGHRPYTYNGTGEDAILTGKDWLEAAIWQAMRHHEVTTRHPVEFVDDVLAAMASLRTVPAREATPLDDPALRYAGCPVSAPASWIRDYDKGDL